jgi:hypothetical protein
MCKRAGSQITLLEIKQTDLSTNVRAYALNIVTFAHQQTSDTSHQQHGKL